MNQKRKAPEILDHEIIEDCRFTAVCLNRKPQGCPHLSKFLKFCWGLPIYEHSCKVFITNKEFSKRRIRAYNYRCFSEGCQSKSRLHFCLFCNMNPVYCFDDKHIHEHFLQTNHNLAMDISHGHVYCFRCNDYIFDDLLTQSLNLLNLASWQSDKCIVLENPLLIAQERQIQAFAENFIIDRFDSSYGLRGLINLGSTCFMNCIVQALVHTPVLRDYFTSRSHTCRFVDKDQCLVCAMDLIFQEFYSGTKDPYIPVSLLHLVWTHAKHLAGYEQQDAHEFFISSLDILHRHSTGNTDLSMNKGCPCFIDSIFSGSLQSDVCCQTCGCVSSKEDPLWDFSLDLVDHENGQSLRSSNQPLSLTDCLKFFTRTEHLGSSAKIKCNNCQTYEESTKKMSMKSLPQVASFHLKRFERTTNRFSKKISSFVSFPLILDMTPFTTERIGYNCPEDVVVRVNPDENKYFLFAVVNHTGTLETGHYTAYIRKNLTDQWFKCDDHFVIRASEPDVLSSEGYLLFYQKLHAVVLNPENTPPKTPNAQIDKI